MRKCFENRIVRRSIGRIKVIAYRYDWTRFAQEFLCLCVHGANERFDKLAGFLWNWRDYSGFRGFVFKGVALSRAGKLLKEARDWWGSKQYCGTSLCSIFGIDPSVGSAFRSSEV